MSEENKSIVQKAMAGLLRTGDVEALGTVLSDEFVHHRPDATASKAEWLARVRAAWKNIADMQVEVLQMVADGDHVVMYSRRRLPNGGPEVVVVDTWRFDGGLIAEAWEVIEPVARAAANLRWWEPA
ncbi:nuclear transport factor 2 family protein [Actinomadura sp. KC216]|uniref:nuclear transport factor 2 family protein n=1 Tax=Actinomadura sp. KC216 TaxID=2530370 RepID=UPI00104F5E46|nr:nuclear transport factor 2 family protein [Actinomadura sp. KC216]TDB90773.1 nuclear transport factor 2 family protein [Actinomadura sp. KC216]